MGSGRGDLFIYPIQFLLPQGKRKGDDGLSATPILRSFTGGGRGEVERVRIEKGEEGLLCYLLGTKRCMKGQESYIQRQGNHIDLPFPLMMLSSIERSRQCRSIPPPRSSQRFRASLNRCAQSLVPYVRTAGKSDSRAKAHYAVLQHVGRAIERCSQTSLTDFFIAGLAEGTLRIGLQLASSVVQSHVRSLPIDWLAL